MTTTWRKSSYSNNGQCVELAAISGAICVRDSKLGEDSPMLAFTRAEALAFLQGAKAGEFDDLV